MSAADGTPPIPAGWYPDPADESRLRRWDGLQWTQDVILAPEQAPVAPVAPTPPTAPNPPAAPSPQVAQNPPDAQYPQVDQNTQAVQAPPAAPSPPEPPTTPRPSPPVNQPNGSPRSGPVSLPEWATLPGLTLPPDLSSLPGMEPDSILHPPTFAEPEQRELPRMPVFEPPFIPQRPDVQDAGRQNPAEPARQPVVPASPAAPYAPPPIGAQYDVPPPPGMAHVPTAGPVLPPSAFVAPQLPVNSRPQLPPVGTVVQTPEAPSPLQSPGLRRVVTAEPVNASLGTVWVWLIALLPLLQFAAIYGVFGVAQVTLAPGMQWGILAAPAAFSLLFANADKKKLVRLDAPSPSVIFGLVPPLYLIVRCVTTGRSSVLPLVAWIVLQAGAAAGMYFLLHSLLLTGIASFG